MQVKEKAANENAGMTSESAIILNRDPEHTDQRRTLTTVPSSASGDVGSRRSRGVCARACVCVTKCVKHLTSPSIQKGTPRSTASQTAPLPTAHTTQFSSCANRVALDREKEASSPRDTASRPFCNRPAALESQETRTRADK